MEGRWPVGAGTRVPCMIEGIYIQKSVNLMEMTGK